MIVKDGSILHLQAPDREPEQQYPIRRNCLPRQFHVGALPVWQTALQTVRQKALLKVSMHSSRYFFSLPLRRGSLTGIKSGFNYWALQSMRYQRIKRMFMGIFPCARSGSNSWWSDVTR